METKDLHTIKTISLEERIDVLSKLGEYLSTKSDYLDAVIHRTHFNNQWFVKENIYQSIDGIVKQFLDKSKLQKWVASYPIKEHTPKIVGLVMAGNIPLVGFHDVLSTFISGNISQIKLSEKDKFLLPYFIKKMTDFNPKVAGYFQFVERIKDFDAVIATGSDNSARYFQSYFGKYPNIIRKNRNSIAILTGKETKDEIIALGHDIFSYFGLGCRNVSKIYIPKGYDLNAFLEILHDAFKKIVMHSKYKNNYDYNYSIWLLNKTDFLMNGCVLLLENETLQSRIATLHYEYYDDIATLENHLELKSDEIQCIVGNSIGSMKTLPLGTAQYPGLMDYADGVDVMGFLCGL